MAHSFLPTAPDTAVTVAAALCVRRSARAALSTNRCRKLMPPLCGKSALRRHAGLDGDSSSSGASPEPGRCDRSAEGHVRECRLRAALGSFRRRDTSPSVGRPVPVSTSTSGAGVRADVTVRAPLDCTVPSKSEPCWARPGSRWIRRSAANRLPACHPGRAQRAIVTTCSGWSFLRTGRSAQRAATARQYGVSLPCHRCRSRDGVEGGFLPLWL